MKTTMTNQTNIPILHSLRKRVGALSVIAALYAMTNAHADDMAIYLDEATLPREQTRPNVVMVLDSSGSMGLPLQLAGYSSLGNEMRRELTRYNHSTDYSLDADGDPKDLTNISGGPGDPNYVYFYRYRNDDYAYPFLYFNKVHRDQLDCDFSTLDDSTPHTMTGSRPSANNSSFWSGYDSFIYNDGTADWGHFCGQYASGCGFTPGPTGPAVDCRNEAASNIITDTAAYPLLDTNNRRRANGLHMVNHNFHNFLQTYYRYTTLQHVVRDLVDVGYDINLSMMQFNGGSGGYVFQESVLATTPSNQTDMKSTVSGIIFDDSTPLAETLWEASRYLRGETVDQGSSSVSAAITGSNYRSPIQYACQKSHIILLTDGDPTSDTDRDSQMGSRIGQNCSGNCLDDYAQWLRHDDGTGSYTGYTPGEGTEGRRDHIPEATLPEEQTIQVHAVGFADASIDTSLLRNAANPDSPIGGLYEFATSADDLMRIFDNMLRFAEFESNSSVSPAVTVNAYSGLQHREEMYFALYRPAGNPRWHGNIKKYKLLDGEIVAHGDVTAIDPETGFFYTNGVRSFWSAEADNDNITAGGVAALLPNAEDRNMYTYTSAAPVYTGSTAPTAVSLNEPLNLNVSNGAVNTTISATPSLLGPSVTTTARAREIIDWVRGGDGDPNMFFPDVIHNPPVAVTYETNSDCLEADPPPADIATCFVDTLYVGTNMGTLHAINTADGTERWSFVPQELLPNLTTYHDRIGGFTDKVYGLDGAMKVWRHDVNKDGTISAANGDHVYLYQPMRRGGTQLYAFNVTDPGQPQLMWQIVGTGLDASPGGHYRDLAQTWSAPQRTKVNWCAGSCSAPREVLIFGGGYDPIHDTAITPVSSSKGNAIYMVDARTSELLWSAGSGTHHEVNDPRLANSFAADVTVGDVNGDGFVDLVYAVDIQGNVWRFDFNNDANLGVTADEVRGGLVAELGGSGNDFRRFYNAPDIAFFSPRGRIPFLTISIASGHREDPRETQIQDYLFTFFDRNANTHPTNYNWDGSGGTIGLNDLGNAGVPTANGWRFALDAVGEKGLSRTVTFQSSIAMTTYIPDSTSTCYGSIGSSRFYMLNALTGESTLRNPDDPNDILAFQQISDRGIPPEPALIFGTGQTCTANCESETPTLVDNTKITLCVGLTCLPTEIEFSASRAYWREN